MLNPLMIYNIINTIFIFIIVLIGSIIFHEAGHLIIFKELNPKIRMRFVYKSWRNFYISTGAPKDYIFLSTIQKLKIYSLGVFMGLIPIFAVGLQYPFYLLVLVPYIFGCENDLILIWGLLKSRYLKL